MISGLKGSLIVSCQAGPDEPLHGSEYMARMAYAAQVGGASGIRADGPSDVSAIRNMVSLPIIGIQKRKYDGVEVYITPTLDDAVAVVRAGADLIALDGTTRRRPGNITLSDMVDAIHSTLRVPVMADLSCLEDAFAAADAGADILATTLAGYTPHGRRLTEGPDLEFLTELVERFSLPVIAEGRFTEPAQVREAFSRGAYAVVVGSAITRPQDITRRFADAIPNKALSSPTYQA